MSEEKNLLNCGDRHDSRQSDKLNVQTPEEYVEFVTRLGSKYSMADFNAKLGTLGLGLGGEAGEIANIVAEVMLLGEFTDDLRLNLIDELGDIMWYVAFGAGNVVNEFFADMVALSSHNEFGPNRLPKSDQPERDLELMYVGLVGECGAVTDIVKKLLYHGKPYDEAIRKKITDSLFEIVDCVTMIANAVCDVPLKAVIDKNVEKLSARYKSLQFTTEEFLKKEEAKSE